MEDEAGLRLEKRKNFLINFSYWSVIIICTFLLIKFIGPILTPFIIAFLISVILNYPVKFISDKVHIRKSFVSIICVIIFYALSGLVLTLVGTENSSIHKRYIYRITLFIYIYFSAYDSGYI